ncbi:MAG: CDP-alcohol phosphatidyltransferase family protein [Candidatus Coatesbacteria bacterium]|nr:CDP-alcohol phosphatidyltransferase family protein [Candidatus Coatesbacteria bacterium]
MEKFLEFREHTAIRFARLFPYWITPNRLTLSRPLFFMPVCIFALIAFHEGGANTYAWIFMISWFLLGLTDFLDGPLSRLTHKTPKPLGQFLDRIADKVSMISLYVFFAQSFVALILPVIILELISAGSALVQWASEEIEEKIGATSVGKWKMTLQWSLIPFLFFHYFFNRKLPFLEYYLGIMLLLTLVSVLAHLYYSGLLELKLLKVIGYFLANITTFTRILLTFILLRNMSGNPSTGMSIIILIFLTDIFDGMIAKQMSASSSFGAWFDMLTDNLIIISFYFWNYTKTNTIIDLYSSIVMTLVTVLFLILPFVSVQPDGQKKLFLNRITHIMVMICIIAMIYKVPYSSYFLALIPLALLPISVAAGWKKNRSRDKKTNLKSIDKMTG